MKLFKHVSQKEMLFYSFFLYFIVLVGALGLGYSLREPKVPTNAVPLEQSNKAEVESSYKINSTSYPYQESIAFLKKDELTKGKKLQARKDASIADLNDIIRQNIKRAKIAKSHKDSHHYFHRAGRYIRIALKRDPNNFLARLARVRVLEANHRFAKANALLVQLETERPKHPELLHLRFTIELALGNYYSALNYALRLRQELPTTAANLALAQVHAELGNDVSARKYFKKAFQREDINEFETSKFLRYIYARFLVRQEQYNESISVLESLFAMDDSHALGIELLGDIAMRSGDYQAAEALMRDALNLRSSYLIKAKLALIRIEATNGELGKSELDRVIQKTRRFVRHHQTGHAWELAQVLIWRGEKRDIQEAVRILDRELKLRRSNLVKDLRKEAMDKLEKLSVPVAASV